VSLEEILKLSAGEIAERVRGQTLRAADVAEAFLGRIEALDPRFNAFLNVNGERARAAARRVDADAAAGRDPGRLAGVPVAVKDNILVEGEPLTCGSRVLEGYRAVYDADAAARLSAEGAVLVGKTNLDEFAMGSSTENSAFFPTRNPWDVERVPGGSSGGSAAAVASGMVPLALGSDTGGSVRQPAGFCGVLGLKPGYGAVSRYGLTAYASSLDQIGILARSAEDAALCLSVIAAHDPKDSTSLPGARPDYPAETAGGLPEGLRVGLPKEYLSPNLDPETGKAVEDSLSVLTGAGARRIDVSLPRTEEALSAYYIVAACEASSNLARFDGMRYGRRPDFQGGLDALYEGSRGEGFGAEVKRRIMLGTYALSAGYYDAFYLKAQKVRTLIRADFEAAFGKADLLLTPLAPTPAFRLGEKADPLDMYLSDVYTLPCNMAGLCGLSVPAGLSAGGLPLAVQLLARPGKEGLLLAAAQRLLAEHPMPRWEDG